MDKKIFIELYQRQKESGLTVKDFCANEIIAPSTFYRWKKILKKQNQLPGFIPVVLNSVTADTPVSLQDSPFSYTTPSTKEPPVIEVEFSNRTIVRLRNCIDLKMLKAIIQLNT